MIKVSALYPNTAGSKFDMPYYVDQHIPMVRQKLGSALRGVSVEEGLGGGQPESPPAYLAMGHLLFDSVEAFRPLLGYMRRQSSVTFRTLPIRNPRSRSAR